MHTRGGSGRNPKNIDLVIVAEFKWDDTAVGMDEHTWLQYVGAYKNLVWKPGTQVIDAAHILKLIGPKVSSVDGMQTVDSETLCIIYEQIQELSNMGEYEQAQLLKEFVDTELVPGKLPSMKYFDEAFEAWKADKLKRAVDDFTNEWGLDGELLEKSVHSYSASQPDIVPYINEIISSVDFGKAANQTAGNLLIHNMTLTEKLPEWIAETMQKYN